MNRKLGNKYISTEVDVGYVEANIDLETIGRYLTSDDISDLAEEKGISLSNQPDDVLAELREAFKTQDKQHFEILLDRLGNQHRYTGPHAGENAKLAA